MERGWARGETIILKEENHIWHVYHCSYLWAGGMRLKAVPQTVINGTTETLEITCRPPPVDEVVNIIVLLHLEKADETSAERLASQRGFDTVLHVTDNRTSAEGQLQGEGMSEPWASVHLPHTFLLTLLT